jgi:hypothetical protein
LSKGDLDGIMLLQKVLRESKFRKQQGVVLKIDFEKAYNKVNWNFMFDFCSQKGFSDDWLIWIKKVVTKGTLSVKINDNIGPYFASCKGVRQGDPLRLFSLTWQQTVWPKLFLWHNKMVRLLDWPVIW